MSEEWLDLLFGNPIGLASIITVGLTLLIGIVIIAMFFIRSGKTEDSDKPGS